MPDLLIHWPYNRPFFDINFYLNRLFFRVSLTVGFPIFAIPTGWIRKVLYFVFKIYGISTVFVWGVYYPKRNKLFNIHIFNLEFVFITYWFFSEYLGILFGRFDHILLELYIFISNTFVICPAHSIYNRRTTLIFR